MNFNQRIYQASKNTLEDVLTTMDYIKLEQDLERGNNDSYWIINYSYYIYEIFAILLELNVTLTRKRVNYFISKGLDLNTKVPFKNDSTYPILKTIENRNYESTKTLIDCGAKVEVEHDNFNSLEIALMGKDVFDREKVFECEKLVYLLDQHCVIENFRVYEWIRKDHCQQYMEESKYLNDVIHLCCPLPEDPKCLL